MEYKIYGVVTIVAIVILSLKTHVNTSHVTLFYH